MYKQFIIVVALLTGYICFSYATIAMAVDNQNGGQVGTDGVISFYEEESSSSETETEDSLETLPSTSSETIQETLKTTYSNLFSPSNLKTLPSTGEIVKAALGGSGVALLVIASSIYVLRRKNKKEEEE